MATIKNLFAPLTDHEPTQLGDFLPTRVDEKYDANPDFNACNIDLSKLDGFLTAIVSGPNAISPPIWLRVVWGDEEPVWASTTKFESIFALVFRHMNSIASMLAEDGDNFEPMFSKRRANAQTHVIVDD